MSNTAEKILHVQDLTVSFKTTQGMVRAVRGVTFDLHKGKTLAIVGESGSGKSVSSRAIMGILAGNGVIEDGQIIYRGQDLTKVDEEHYHELRGNKIGMIFQDPMSSLNPIMKIGKQITEGMLLNGNRLKERIKHASADAKNMVSEKINDLDELRIKFNNIKRSDSDNKASELSAVKNEIANVKLELAAARLAYKKAVVKAKKQVEADFVAEKKRVFAEIKSLKQDPNNAGSKEKIAQLNEQLLRYRKVTKKEAYERAIQIMKEVGIPEPERRFTQYPFQFSGGMRQRIVIAIALTASPEILICDEPTTALDVTIQAQILELINNLKTERNLSVIFITHDLGVVANMADSIGVMYAGKIVEMGTSEEIFYEPKHPYTWALLSSMPDLDSKDRLRAIPGTPPNMLFPPVGDAFAERNEFAMKIDFEKQPPMFKISETHSAATWLLHPNAPKVEMPKIIQDRIDRMLGNDKEEAVNEK
ncbi:MAG: ATP-binding cassette domain-containing protein [Bacilli bacterium]|nr:ATP-binding cassette domain-containing protein [Bacilli bacterium]